MAIEVLKKSILQKNDQAAEQSRALLQQHELTAINLMGGAGCGKTTLLERTIPQLREKLRVAVLEGDIATTKDAARIDALGVPVIQLLTEGGCHLTATHVQAALNKLPLSELDLVLIENVGNPVCPANFDLGEAARVAVLSVTEGDDKPAKYPYLFKVADLVMITKTDLAALTDFDIERAMHDIRVLDPHKEILLSGKKDEGEQAHRFANWILQQVQQKT